MKKLYFALITIVFISGCAWLSDHKEDVSKRALTISGAGVAYSCSRGEDIETIKELKRHIDVMLEGVCPENVDRTINIIIDYLEEQIKEKSNLNEDDKQLVSAGITLIKLIEINDKKRAVKCVGYFLDGVARTLEVKIQKEDIEGLLGGV